MNSLLQSLRTLPHNLSNLKPPHANSPADPLTLYSTNQRAATREVLSLSSTTKPINPAHILFPPIKPNKIPNSYQKPSHLILHSQRLCSLPNHLPFLLFGILNLSFSLSHFRLVFAQNAFPPVLHMVGSQLTCSHLSGQIKSHLSRRSRHGSVVSEPD